MKLFFNIKGIFRSLFPFSPSLKKIFKTLQNNQWKTRSDAAYIEDRVNYYCKLDSIHSLKNSVPLKHFRFPKKNSAYYFDTFKYSSLFPQNLRASFEFGDVNYFFQTPTITKSRPIKEDSKGDYKNSVLLNLDKFRHFSFIKDSIPFALKKDLLFYRGGIYQEHRIKFFDKYFNHPLCDLGHTGRGDICASFLKSKVKKKFFLLHKFILALEGNDVASNLKWVMNSNSIAVMPRPKYETWFMEGRLKGDYHYIEIDSNYSNLEEKLDFYIKNPLKAENIIVNANKFVEQFLDKEREDLISLLVLEKYFKFTN